MGFFKDLKKDLSQAVNELLPMSEDSRDDGSDQMVNTLDSDSMTDTEEAENEMKEWLDGFLNEEKAEEKTGSDTETAPIEDDFRVQMDLNDINDVPDIQDLQFSLDFEEIKGEPDARDSDVKDTDDTKDMEDKKDVEDGKDLKDDEGINDADDIGNINNNNDINDINDIRSIEDIKNFEEILNVHDIKDIDNIHDIVDINDILDERDMPDIMGQYTQDIRDTQDNQNELHTDEGIEGYEKEELSENNMEDEVGVMNEKVDIMNEESMDTVIDELQDNVDLDVLDELNAEDVQAEKDKEPEKKVRAASTARDDEVTVISKGTTINGSISSDGSLDIMGNITGDVECLGKLSITGKIIGNSTAAEVYVNTERLEGSITSEGSVKIGLGTVVIGDISASSAVIAGAVKGEIDVNGPVVIDSTAIIKGNIKAKSVQINNGAVVDGYCSLSYADVDLDNIFE